MECSGSDAGLLVMGRSLAVFWRPGPLHSRWDVMSMVFVLLCWPAQDHSLAKQEMTTPGLPAPTGNMVVHWQFPTPCRLPLSPINGSHFLLWGSNRQVGEGLMYCYLLYRKYTKSGIQVWLLWIVPPPSPPFSLALPGGCAPRITPTLIWCG